MSSTTSPLLALYLINDSPHDRRVLAAWPFCIKCGDTSADFVAQTAGLTVSFTIKSIERLSTLGLLNENGIAPEAASVILSEVKRSYESKK